MNGRHGHVADVLGGYALANEGIDLEAVNGNRDAAVHGDAAARHHGRSDNWLEVDVRLDLNLVDFAQVRTAVNGGFDIGLRHADGEGRAHAHKAAGTGASDHQRIWIIRNRFNVEVGSLGYIAVHVGNGLIAQAHRGTGNRHADERTVRHDGDHANGAVRQPIGNVHHAFNKAVARRVLRIAFGVGVGVGFGVYVDIARRIQRRAVINAGNHVAVQYRNGHADSNGGNGATTGRTVKHFGTNQIRCFDVDVTGGNDLRSPADDRADGILGVIRRTRAENAVRRLNGLVVFRLDFSVFSAAGVLLLLRGRVRTGGRTRLGGRTDFAVVNVFFVEIVAAISAIEVGYAVFVAGLNVGVTHAVALEHFVEVVHVIPFKGIAVEHFTVELLRLEALVVGERVRAVLIQLAAGHQHHDGRHYGNRSGGGNVERVGAHVAFRVRGHINAAGSGRGLNGVCFFGAVGRRAGKTGLDGVVQHGDGGDHAHSTGAAARNDTNCADELRLVKRRYVDIRRLDVDVVERFRAGRLLGNVHNGRTGNGGSAASGHADRVDGVGFVGGTADGHIAVGSDGSSIKQQRFGSAFIIGNNCHRRHSRRAGAGNSARHIDGQNVALRLHINVAANANRSAKLGIHFVLENQRIRAAGHGSRSARTDKTGCKRKIDHRLGLHFEASERLHIALDGSLHRVVINQRGRTGRHTGGSSAHAEAERNHNGNVLGVVSAVRLGVHIACRTNQVARAGHRVDGLPDDNGYRARTDTSSRADANLTSHNIYF